MSADFQSSYAEGNDCDDAIEFRFVEKGYWLWSIVYAIKLRLPGQS